VVGVFSDERIHLNDLHTRAGENLEAVEGGKVIILR
jgi:hypothetical protein